jgi:hypothetical protein
MSTILAYPTKPEDERSLKAFLKALKINFETSPYNPDFVEKIERSMQQIKEGKSTTISSKKELHTFLESL